MTRPPKLRYANMPFSLNCEDFIPQIFSVLSIQLTNSCRSVFRNYLLLLIFTVSTIYRSSWEINRDNVQFGTIGLT